MQTIELRPGTNLNIITETEDNPVGRKVTTISLTYEDLLNLLKTPGTSKKSRSEGRVASRKICLYAEAINRGMWRHNRKCDIETMSSKLTEVVLNLDMLQYDNVTLRAREKVLSVYMNMQLPAPIRNAAKRIYEKLGGLNGRSI